MIPVFKAIERIAVLLAMINGILTLAIVVIVVCDITGRTFFNSPLMGANELATLLLVCVIFLGFAAAQQNNHLFSVDLVVCHLSERNQRRARIFNLVLAILFSGFFSVITSELAWDSFLRKEASFDIISFPIWPSRIFVAVGFIFLTLQLIIDLVRDLTRPANAVDPDDGETNLKGAL